MHACHSPATLKLEEGQSDGELLQFFVALPEQDKYLLIFVFLKLGECASSVSVKGSGPVVSLPCSPLTRRVNSWCRRRPGGQGTFLCEQPGCLLPVEAVPGAVLDPVGRAERRAAPQLPPAHHPGVQPVSETPGLWMLKAPPCA
jgi:hypothetical protein